MKKTINCFKIFLILVLCVVFNSCKTANNTIQNRKIETIHLEEKNDLYIYVSPSGNDQNPGTPEQPVYSLSAACYLIRMLQDKNTLNGTIYVEIMPGEYFMDKTLELTSLDTGTKQSPIVFRGKPNARTVFYGGKETSQFEVIRPGLWRVFIPEVIKSGIYFEQLYVNGGRRFCAQTPNRGEFNMVKSMEEKKLNSSEELNFSQKVFIHEDGEKILKELDSEEIRDVKVMFYHKWYNIHKWINSINIQDNAFYIKGSTMKNMVDQNSRYIIENYRKALDTPGEWYLQRDGYLYYIPLQGETPENTRCIFPVIEEFILIKGKRRKPVEYISFENLSFQMTKYQMPPDGNRWTQAAADIGATVMIDFANNINFLNCEISHTGLHGIWFRKACSYSKVEHCYLYDLGGGAIKIGDLVKSGKKRLTNHITIHNNILHHGGYVFPSAVGVIIFNGSDNEITNNEIADFRYSGVSVGWVWGYANSPSKRNKIEFNHIHHLGWGELDDMGGVYTLGDSEGTTVSNNVIHHVYSYQYGGWGLYTDEGTKGILMENNLVYACKDAGFHQHYGKDNIIKNNIFALIQKSAVQISLVEEHLSYTFMNNIIYQNNGNLIMDTWGGDNGTKIRANFDNNCYWKERGDPVFYGLSFDEWKNFDKDKNSIIAEPQFINPQKFDFRFKNTSVVSKIGFLPFDYNKAGVYGSDEWVKKAKMSVELEKEYENAVGIFFN